MEDSIANSSAKPKWDEETYVLAKKLMRKMWFIKEHDRDDVLQDYATHKNPNLEGFEGRSKFSSWLYSCLYKFSVDYARVHYKIRIPEEDRPKDISLDDQAENDPEANELLKEVDEATKQHPEHKEWLDWAISFGWRMVPWNTTSLPWNALSKWSDIVLLKPVGPEDSPIIQAHIDSCRLCDKVFQLMALASIDYFFEIRSKDLGYDNFGSFLDNIGSKDEIHKFFEGYADMTIIDEAIKAKAEYEQKKDAAIKELLNRQREIEAQLKNLGYHAVATKTKDQGPAKGQRICSKCKKAGHNSRTCPENKAKDHKGKVSRNAAA